MGPPPGWIRVVTPIPFIQKSIEKATIYTTPYGLAIYLNFDIIFLYANKNI
jgi:hypothetical protein